MRPDEEAMAAMQARARSSGDRPRDREALLEVLWFPPELIADAVAAADWQRRRSGLANQATEGTGS